MTALLGTSAASLTLGAQMRFGFAGRTSKSDGWAEVTVDDIPVARVDEVNTAFSDAVSWRGMYIGLSSTIFASHMYGCEGEGDLPSDLVADIRYGDVVGAYQQWTPNIGTQVTAIDDVSPDADTTRIDSLAVGRRFTNQMAAMAERLAIYGTQATAVVRNYIPSGGFVASGSTSVSFRHVMILAGTVFIGDWQGCVQEEWRAITIFHEKNPKTLGPWTAAELNEPIERGGETES